MTSRAALLSFVAAALVASTAPGQSPVQRRGFSIRITEPENQSVVLGKTKVAATVTVDDPTLVDRVEFLISDEVVFVDREPPYEFLYDFNDTERSYVVRAIAHHKEGVEVSDVSVTRRIIVSNIAVVNRVILWVSATDKQDRFVADLDRNDFTVMEDGKPQTIIDFHHEERPIVLAILIDASGSMRDKIKEVHKAAGSFVDSLREMDQALVIDFDDNVFLIQELTSDKEALREAVSSTEPLGATAVFDALRAAYRKIGTIDGRKAIILLSDGDDTASQFSYDRVLEEAKANDTMIYSIALGGETGTMDKGVLREFADVTGGRLYVVKKAEELGEVYARIAEELGRQYYLTYSTTNERWDGHWVGIKVDSKRPGVAIRSRRGYFAVRKGEASPSRAATAPANPGGAIASSSGISSSGDGS